MTARQLACLDVLSGGQIVAGIGAGWMAEEFAVVGGPSFSARGRATEEAIEIFRSIWRNQPASFECAIYRFYPVGARPKPVQVDGIPMVLGGKRPRCARACRPSVRRLAAVQSPT
jgi:alkanesulfonate monooxygenase SsuD/methylene tetrahydromethanopterin reductase-like flavin-dependent oxidoreductase (luciferase family)